MTLTLSPLPPAHSPPTTALPPRATPSSPSPRAERGLR